MYGERRSPDFIAGLHKFLVVAEANKEDGFMPCPCVDCRTLRSTLTREPFKATCFEEVSCPAIIVGPSTEKEGL